MTKENEQKYLMPTLDKKHSAISSRITMLQFLKKMDHTNLVQDSGIDPLEFSLMEFCYDPKNDASLCRMIHWLDHNEYLIKNYFGEKEYHQEFEPLHKYYALYFT